MTETMSFKDKPIDINKHGNIVIYEMSVNKYGDYYNFKNREGTVNDFFKNVCSKFQITKEVILKCRFLIENIQQSMNENLRPIFNTRYWSTEIYKMMKYFNDYIFYSLKENIFKRVIINGIPGSS